MWKFTSLGAAAPTNTRPITDLQRVSGRRALGIVLGPDERLPRHVLSWKDMQVSWKDMQATAKERPGPVSQPQIGPTRFMSSNDG